MQTVIKNAKNYIKRVSNFRDAILANIESSSSPIWLDTSLEDVKKVVIILSAPRSGSSLLFSILKFIPGIYSLRGESVPFYKLNALSSDDFSSDEISQELINNRQAYKGLSRDFLSDFYLTGFNKNHLSNNNLIGQYIDDLAMRFSMQWPQIEFSYKTFKRIAYKAIDSYFKKHKVFSVEEFYLELLNYLIGEYNQINPYYYDIPKEKIKKIFPDIMIPSGPPNNVVMIEEPPFILLSPAEKLKAGDLNSKILLLKTSLNSYRMNYIEQIFSGADIKIVYLTRNPLASINGLYDGWLHRGFLSHNLRSFFEANKELKSLEIKGYSDIYEWGKWWWNYDLPLGWQAYANKHLEEVCAFQWVFANKSIQKYVNCGKITACKVKYEDILGNAGSRQKIILGLVDFIGISPDAARELNLDRLPVVQATCPPKPFRWKKRKSMLLSFIDDPVICSMSKEMGYDSKDIDEWL